MNRTFYVFDNNIYEFNERTNNNIFLTSLNINKLEFNIMKIIINADDSIKKFYKKYKFPIDKKLKKSTKL
jgi:hypothetical protein